MLQERLYSRDPTSFKDCKLPQRKECYGRHVVPTSFFHLIFMSLRSLTISRIQAPL